MKYLIASVIVVVLFVLPLGSWYYLQTGFNYRKAAMEDLTPKGIFAVDRFDERILKSKTTLIQVSGENGDFLAELHDQFKKSKTFQLLSVDQASTNADSWKVLGDSSIVSLKNNFGDAAFILIDTSGVLRSTYIDEASSKKKMIEQLAILLPRVKELEVKQSR